MRQWQGEFGQFGFGGGGTPSPTPTPSAPLTSIDADGWQANYNGTPPATVLNTLLTGTAPGFDDNGSAITRALPGNLRITARLREPGLTSLQALKVGLSWKLTAGAVIAGVTNNSTQVAPPPIANWAVRFQQLIGNQDRVLEVVASHYYGGMVAGRQVACAEFIINRGLPSELIKRTATVVWSSVDQKPVPVMRVTVTAAEMAALPNGIVTYDCNVYPLIGVAASVARTQDAAARGFPAWKFAQRYDVKDPARAAAPALAYLSTTGNDTTGLWSTNDATARANPFLTLAGALAAGKISAIPAGDVVPSGTVDGCRIAALAGTFAVTTAAATVPQYGACLIITKAVEVERAAAIYNVATNYFLRVGQTGLTAGAQACLQWENCTYQRSSATSQFGPTFSTAMHVVDVAWAGGSITGGFGGANVVGWFERTAFSGLPSGSSSALVATAPGAVGLVRGCTGDINGCTIFGYNVLGSALQNVGTFAPTWAALNPSNANIIANIVDGDQGTTFNYGSGTLGDTINGLVVALNVVAWTTTTSNPSWRVSGDGNSANTVQVLEYQNTTAGAHNYGRHNDRYVDTDATATRTHIWGRSQNNIMSSYNTKHDLFSPANPARIGGWEISWNVGFFSNYVCYAGASGSFDPDYAAPSMVFGASTTVSLPVRFKDYRGTTLSPLTAGTLGGNYRLQRISEGDANDSPCLVGAESELFPGFGTVIGAYP